MGDGCRIVWIESGRPREVEGRPFRPRTMPNAIPVSPVNEPVLGYAPGGGACVGSRTRPSECRRARVPCIINGEEVWTGNVVEQVMHNHAHVLARVHLAGEAEFSAASMPRWPTLMVHHAVGGRAAVFLKAGELLAGPRRGNQHPPC